MRQGPKRLNLMNITDACMCKNSQCIQKDSDHGSSCFVKCVDLSTNQRFEWDAMSRGCSCPVCKCECPGVWHREDRFKIALGISQVINSKAMVPNAEAPELGLRNFLTRAAFGGISLVDAVTKSIPGNAIVKRIVRM